MTPTPVSPAAPAVAPGRSPASPAVRRRRLRPWVIAGLVLLAAGAAAVGVSRLRHVQTGEEVPSMPVRQGEFLVIVRCRGDLEPRHSVGFYTPMVPNLRIAWMAPGGEPIKQGEPIIRFDSSQAQQQLAQKEASLQSAQASLDQFVAQNRINVEQDKSDLSDAQYAVETAKLDVTMKSLKSPIDGQEAQITEKVSEQKLKAEEAKVDLDRAADQSKLASLTRLRDQAKADVDLAKSRIAQMEIKAPGTGLLTFQLNYQGSIGSSDAKPYKVGDTVWSGMGLGEIPDVNTLELVGKIEEIDRGRIAVGQDVLVKLDALPELTLPAKLGQISPLAEVSLSEFPPTRSFLASAQILHPDPRLRPSMNGGMDIVVNKIPHAISIPARALFTKSGQPVVYVRRAGGYRAVGVKVEARNPDEIAISGVPAGTVVALQDIAREMPRK
ncbi:MAG TPA: HlyD family efflux transporter periplasmic adaptor subunit [Bryobacteraceae bacterium]|nr:HlyD family efflux transporter periplasmic adaptor subunit [Bryobacteraceae bacterium]